MADEKDTAVEEETPEGEEEVVVEPAGDKPNETGAKPVKKETTDDDGKGEETPEPDLAPDPATIPVRSSASQFIIARKNKQIEKLKSKVEKEEEAEEEAEEDPADNDVKEIVNRHVAPVVETLTKQIDEGELKDFFREEPDAKNYEKRMRVYLAHPAYKGVHPSVIFHHLAYGGSQAAAVKKKQAADLEAKQSKGGGRAAKPSSGEGDLPSADEINNMSDAELEKLQNKVMSGGN